MPSRGARTAAFAAPHALKTWSTGQNLFRWLVDLAQQLSR
jgi:hypothetical protein